VSLPKPGSSPEIYLEVGQKKVFAVAVNWPGWCRAGKDEESAAHALLEAAPRYAEIVRDPELAYAVPDSTSRFKIAARLRGNATTDFGAPDIQLPGDWDPMEPKELERFVKILNACWAKLDRAIEKGRGKELRKGPRGGGRDLMKIIDHVVGSEEGYLGALGWSIKSVRGEAIDQRKDRVRVEVLRGLEAAADGQIPREGPRGGKRWPARSFLRRLAWHAVDHAWEIEDRII
jgi:hypothetical protein